MHFSSGLTNRQLTVSWLQIRMGVLQSAQKCSRCNWSKTDVNPEKSNILKEYSKRIFDFVIFLDWHQNNSFVAKINVFVCLPWQNMSCCLLFVKAFVVQVSHYNERKLPQNQMKQCAIGTHTVSSFQISQQIIWNRQKKNETSIVYLVLSCKKKSRCIPCFKTIK